ncbi:MAG: DUF3302 domain-containing protein [Planctomycetales bacterium]
MQMLLDYFALAVLLILVTAGVVIWVLLGIMPGRIARDRNHPQADAISVCGWWGVLTLGLLLPLAYIWAYSNPRWRDECRAEKNETKEDDKI